MKECLGMSGEDQDMQINTMIMGLREKTCLPGEKAGSEE